MSRERPYKLADGGGLHLLVQPNGNKYWRLKYRHAGKEKLLSFGRYPGCLERSLGRWFVEVPEGRKKTRNTEHVIEMAVGWQAPVKPSETGAAAQQLTLGALPAIHQDAMTTRLDKKRGVVAFKRQMYGRSGYPVQAPCSRQCVR